MVIERRMGRHLFEAGQTVELKHLCFTPGRLFQPGHYLAGELPDVAFDMGLVEALPPVRGKSEQHPPEALSSEPPSPESLSPGPQAAAPPGAEPSPLDEASGE